ncbi:MAG: hypothetical protein ACRCX2_29990 [Paraclostridium sp.]
MYSFYDILEKKHKGNVPHRLLCLDPGNMTGACLFIDGKLSEGWQAPTAPKDNIDWNEVEKLITETNPTHVVCEDYRIYAHKLEQHTFHRVPTLRIIGTLTYLCWKNDIPIKFQMAQQAKSFCTDDKLKAWGFWTTGMRHCRDAIRHGTTYLLFNKHK